MTMDDLFGGAAVDGHGPQYGVVDYDERRQQ